VMPTKAGLSPPGRDRVPHEADLWTQAYTCGIAEFDLVYRLHATSLVSPRLR
jgi:hypothetical protein